MVSFSTQPTLLAFVAVTSAATAPAVAAPACSAECAAEFGRCIGFQSQTQTTTTAAYSTCSDQLRSGSHSRLNADGVCDPDCIFTATMSALGGDDAGTGDGTGTGGTDAGDGTGTDGTDAEVPATPSPGGAGSTEKPTAPAVCTAVNQGACDCPAEDGWTTYTWWMEDGADRASEAQRCVQIYVPPAHAHGAIPAMVHSNCYSGYGNPISRSDIAAADRYGYAVMGLSAPDDRRAWIFPNDGVVNEATGPTPCTDADSVDLDYARTALELLGATVEVDAGRIFSEGFSQNSMWSAVMGVCFPEHVIRFMQGGSGLKYRGVDPTPPGKQGECSGASFRAHGRGCEQIEPCDGQAGRPECKWWPLYPAAAEGRVEAAKRIVLQSCQFIAEGDYLFGSQKPMFDALAEEGHAARYVQFPGGGHQMPDQAIDWVVGCLGITEKCSAECAADFATCVETGTAWNDCLTSELTRPASCAATCAPTLAMLSLSATPSELQVAGGGTFDAWPERVHEVDAENDDEEKEEEPCVSCTGEKPVRGRRPLASFHGRTNRP